MLQKPEDITKEMFLAHVEKLNLRFPVTRIAQETGFDKSTVSKYLKGEVRPSTNFLKEFYKWLEKSGINLGDADVILNDGNKLVVVEAKSQANNGQLELVQSLKAQIALHEKINSGLEKRLENVETNLNAALSNQKVIMTMLTVAMSHAADFFSSGNKAKADALRRKMMTDIASAQEKIL